MTTASNCLYLVPAHQLCAAVRVAVAQRKAGDPLAPVAVCVPHGVAGQSLARGMACSGGVVNVQFVPLARLAATLGGAVKQSQGERRVTTRMQRELARLVARQARPSLTAQASPVLVQSLVKSFGELRLRSDAEISAVASRGPLQAEIVRLYRLFRERSIAVGAVDNRELVERAQAAVMVDGAAMPVVAVLAQPPFEYEADLFRTLSMTGQASVVGLLSGDEVLDTTLQYALEDMVGAEGQVVGWAPLPLPDQVVVAPDADVELRVAVEHLLEQASKAVPFHRCAVVVPEVAPYPALAVEHLEAAGIAWSGRSPATLGRSVTGRFLSTWLSLTEHGIGYERLADWLSTVTVPLPVSTWLRLLRQARAGSDAAQWPARLRAHAQAHSSQVQVVEEFLVFLAEVQELVAHAAQAGTWSEHVDLVLRCVNRFLEGAGDRTQWPVVEQQAAVDIERALGELSELGLSGRSIPELAVPGRSIPELGGGGVVSQVDFNAGLREELSTVQRRMTDSAGVFVGSFREVAASSFDAVVVCGMVEGVVPNRARNDVLLGALPLPAVERDVDRQRRQFLHAMAAGTYRLVTTARVDHRQQRELRPSPWLLQLVGEQAGRPVGAHELLNGSFGLLPAARESSDQTTRTRESSDQTTRARESSDQTTAARESSDQTTRTRVRTVASFTAALREIEPLSAHWFGVAELLRWQQAGADPVLHPLVRSDAALMQGLECARARSSGVLSRFDGVTGSQALLRRMTGGVVSVTSFERWATCPFSHFLSSVLGVGGQQADGEELAVTPLDRGLLVHELLERFVREADPRETPSQPWTTQEREELFAIADELWHAARQAGRVPPGLMWEAEQSALRVHLDTLLDEDVSLRQAANLLPGGVEVQFGSREAALPAVRIARGNGSGTVAFRGRIDRVDRSPDGRRLRALDYKTGRSASYADLRDDPVGAGRRLQLGIYAAALRAEQVHDHDVIDAMYWFVTDAEKGYPQRQITLEPAVSDRVAEVVGHIAEGIEEGVFPAVPGQERHRSYEHCRHCPYDRLCPADRGEAWARKQHDSLANPVLALARSEETVDAS